MPAIPAVAAAVATGTGMAASIGGAIGLGSGLAAATVGAGIVGAVAGGVVAAVQGEDILEGAVKGGITGAAVGFVGSGGLGEVMGGAEGATGGEIMAGTGDTATVAGESASVAGGTAAESGSTVAIQEGSSIAAPKMGSGGSGFMTETAGSADGFSLTGDAASTLGEGSEFAATTAGDSATSLAANSTVKTTLEAGSMADTGGFLSGLSSGEKMMAMTSLSGAAEGWMAGESAEDAAKAQEEAFNRIQLNSDSDASTGLLMSSDTSFQPSTSTQLNSSSKVQKPTIRRPTVKGSSYVTA